jgi:hypothetical protein
MAHSLQLVVQDTLGHPGMAKAWTAINSLLSKFHGNSNAVRKLHEAQSSRKTRLGLLRPTPTRWNSTYRSMNRLLELKPYVEIVLSADGYSVPESDWADMRTAVEVLQPFADATDHCQSDCACLASVSAVLRDVLDKMRAFSSDSGSSAKGEIARMAVESSLKNRWEENFNASLLLAAVAIDPWKWRIVSGSLRVRAKELMVKFGIPYLKEDLPGEIR